MDSNMMPLAKRMILAEFEQATYSQIFLRDGAQQKLFITRSGPRRPGLGFNGVVIDLQHHFKTYTNYQNLPKINTKICDNVLDFGQLRAIESQSSGSQWYK